MFVLDTDHITIIQRQNEPQFSRLKQRMSQHPRSDFYYSIVSFHEQVLGANVYINRARTAQTVAAGYDLLQQVRADFAAAQVLPFDQAASALCDSLRAQKLR